jgi:hypothetical protein
MRKCPQCGQRYGDDSIFCVSDGASLADSESNHRVVVSLDDPKSNEVPTQYVPAVQHAQPVTNNSGILYVTIGALIAIIAIGGSYILLRGPEEIVSAPTAITNSGNAASPTPDLNTNGLFTGGVSNSTPAPTDRIASNTAVANAFNAAAAAANAAAESAAAWANRVADNSAARPSRRFRRTYAGTVDDDSIEMFLEKNGSSLTGRVAPGGRQAEIYLEGYVRDDGTFEMDEKSDIGVVTGVYRGRLNGNSTITGTWSKPDGAKTRSMYLRSQ